jgi:hypothetical protein
MNRASSSLATKVLAAASCLGGLGELSTKEASAQIAAGSVEVFFVQYPDGGITRYESTGVTPFKPGEHILIHEATGIRQGTVIVPPALTWGVPTARSSSTVIQELAPPRSYTTPTLFSDQLVLPLNPLDNASGSDALLRSTLRERISFIGPSDIHKEVVDSAISAYIAAARSWFGTVPPMPPVLLEVEISSEKSYGFMKPELIYGSTALSRRVKIVEPAHRVVSTTWHEFAHVATHNALGESVPRWFDEGLACLMEHQDTVATRKQSFVISVHGSNKDFPLHELFQGIYYPVEEKTNAPVPEGRKVATLEEAQLFYAKSTTLVDYLVTRSPGKDLHEQRQYATGFIGTIMAAGCTLEAYSAALKQFYKISDLSELDTNLKEWASKPYRK